jgi:PII-like signaling protein
LNQPLKWRVPVKVLRPFANFLYKDQLSAEELAGISVELPLTLLLLNHEHKIAKLRLL